MKLHILSWNIWFGTYFDNVMNYLTSNPADIIGLQEVTQTPDGKSNIGEKIANILGYSYVYATGMDLRPYSMQLVMGNAILTKYPIIASKVHALSEKESRVAIQADISVGENIFHVFNTHLLHTHQKPSAIQEEQARKLIQVAKKDKTIIMGDFNATPESAAIQLMNTSLKNVDASLQEATWSVYPKGCDVCLPQKLNVRLDYIYTTHDIQTNNFKVGNSKASDHLPISVDVEV